MRAIGNGSNQNKPIGFARSFEAQKKGPHMYQGSGHFGPSLPRVAPKFDGAAFWRFCMLLFRAISSYPNCCPTSDLHRSRLNIVADLYAYISSTSFESQFCYSGV